MDKPTEIPEEVTSSFNLWKSRNKLRRCTDGVPDLCWDYLGGYYYFVYNKIYYGIELNGYLHT